MDHVILLSDSEESHEEEEEEEDLAKETDCSSERKKSTESHDASIDFHFPSIHFSYANDLDFSTNTLTQKLLDNEIEKAPSIYELSSDCESEERETEASREVAKQREIPYGDDAGTRCGLKSNLLGKSSAHSISESSETDAEDQRRLKNLLDVDLEPLGKRAKKVKDGASKIANKRDREKLRDEKLRKKEELAKEKAKKTIASKKLKNVKPGECLKFMEVMFDEKISRSTYYPEIIDTLQRNGINRHSVAFYSLPNSITWRRNTEDYYLNESHEICKNIIPETEKHMIIIWDWEDVIKFIADDTFSTCISSIKALVPNYNLTLVVYNIEEYFAYRKKGNSESKSDRKQNRMNGTDKFQNLPAISREKFETCLTEIQVLSKCNSRLIETSQDLALTIYQYTKSIAEIPHKMDRHGSIATNYDWYVFGDKKQTVNVAKSGHGLKRLWQQQLCQFNLMSLETAEAISSKYPSPIALMEAYTYCTPEDGANLLKDIPIRRAAGPLTTSRKIGPELSRKIYTMFTAKNPKTLLD